MYVYYEHRDYTRSIDMEGGGSSDGSKGTKEYPLDMVETVVNQVVDGVLMPKVFPAEFIRAAKT